MRALLIELTDKASHLPPLKLNQTWVKSLKHLECDCVFITQNYYLAKILTNMSKDKYIGFTISENYENLKKNKFYEENQYQNLNIFHQWLFY